MKILLTMNLPLTRCYGGANKSNKILAEELAVRGHEVWAVTPALAVPSDVTHKQLLDHLANEGTDVSIHQRRYSFKINGVNIRAAIEPEYLWNVLQSTIAEVKPDWILISTEDPSQSLFRAAYEVSPNNLIYLGHTKYMLPFGPLSFYPGEKRTELIKKAKSIITISKYNANYIRRYSGIETFVNHPPHFGDSFQNLGEKKNEYILMVNPCAVKGISIFLKIVEALPNQKFAVVPGWGTTSDDMDSLKRHQNITFWENTPDLNLLFKDVSLLLMPSLWVEGFGMIVIDALVRGVPVISSNHGGLPEAKVGTNYQIQVRPISKFEERLDGNGFPVAEVPEQEIEPWVKSITLLLSNENLYRHESELSTKNAMSFITALSVDPLIAHLEKLSDKTAQEKISRLTISQKMELLEKMKDRKRGGTAAIRNIKCVEKRQYYGVSYSQKQALLQNEIGGGLDRFILSKQIEYIGDIDIDAFYKVFQHLILRHDSLKTEFFKLHGEFKQRVLDGLDFKITETDWTAKGIDDKESKKKQEEITGNFNLEKAPLWRVEIIKLPRRRNLIFIVIHHAISDGFSMQILSREIVELYDKFSNNLKSELKPLRIQYKDYVEWQKDFQLSREAYAGRMYWHKQLSGKLPLINLPLDNPRKPIKTFVGKSVRLNLSKKQSQSLLFISKINGTSLFNIFLGLVKVLLFRYTAQSDIIVGTPIAGRFLEDLKAQIGFFVNMVAIRTSIDENDTFKQLLEKLKLTTAEAYDFEFYPFDKLIDEIATERDLSRSPVFDIMVSMSVKERDIAFKKIHHSDSIERIIIGDERVISSHDLAFGFLDSNENIEINVTYNLDLFEQSKVVRLCEHLEKIIDTVASHTDIRIADIDIVTDQEKIIMLHHSEKLNTNAEKLLVHERFEKVASEIPDSVACEFRDQQITYGVLNETANRLACEIRNRGIIPGNVVAIVCTHSLETIISILGVLKAGGCYLPVDASLPTDRIDYCLTDSDCKLVLADCKSASTHRLLENRDVILFKDIQSMPHDNRNPGQVNIIDDLCYVIYTSGSTGKPKGVMVQHNNVAQLFSDSQSIFNFSKSDIWLLFHSFGFDFSVWEIFGAILFGGKVIVLEKETAQNTFELAHILQKKTVTILNQVPGAFANLLQEDVFGLLDYLSLRYVIFGGDVLYPNKLRKWREKFSSTELVNMYGITETTVHVTYKRIDWEDIEQDKSNIGRPLPNVSVFLLDKKMKLVPIGIPGEIFVSGAGVCRGYLKEPHLTSEKFMDNPYRSAERLFRTGDIARYLPNGELEYLGRVDSQVQIRGYRIELKEIEAVIKKFRLVDDAIVLDYCEKDEERFLVAFLLSKFQLADYIDEFRRFIGHFLPRYMIPAFFIEIEKIPLTDNGKIDKKALPHSEYINVQSRAIKMPTTEIETLLYGIWKDVLESENFGIEDDFFEIGGHSLRAVKVIALINRKMNIHVKLGLFFEHSTIKELARVIAFLSSPDQLRDMQENEVEIIL